MLKLTDLQNLCLNNSNLSILHYKNYIFSYNIILMLYYILQS